jgi:hypothetical protein
MAGTAGMDPGAQSTGSAFFSQQNIVVVGPGQQGPSAAACGHASRDPLLAAVGDEETIEAGGFCGGQLVGAVVGAPSQQADDPVQKLLVEAGVRWPAAAESCEILK